jgi:hypothetical protein
MRHVRTAEKITKSHPVGSERFRSVCANNFEIRNLYAKNIMFACSLTTSTSTWRCDHRNGPGGYMSGELKSENIKYRTSPHSKKPSSSKRSTIVPSHTNKSQKDISTLYSTMLQYSKDPQDLQDHTTKTLLDQQDPHGLLFTLERNYDRRPRTLPEISRRV